MAEVSVSPFQEPALCAFRTAAEAGLEAKISAFPFMSGPLKDRSLAKIKNDLRRDVGKSASLGLTYQLTEHPEWGTDAFSLLEYGSGKPEGVQIWTRKYSAQIDDQSGQVSAAAYLADAKALGDALVAVSK